MILQDKVVVVSGVGPGLGRSIVLRAARAGADVVLAARTQSRLDAVAKEVADLGRRALTVRTDIGDEASAAALVDTALAEFGHVDALVNNAFGMPPMTNLADVDFDAIRAAFDVTLFGGLRLTRLFTPALAASKGAVVMINSSVIRHTRQPYGPYKITKAALLAASQSLATELGPQGIRVNTVVPGWIWADTLQWYFDYLAKKREVPAQQLYDETAATLDLRRLPEPDEIADAAVFLASPMARSITGQTLDVDCGEFHQ